MQYRLISRQDAADVKVSLFGLLVITAFLMLLDPFLHRLWPLEKVIPGFAPNTQYALASALFALIICAVAENSGDIDIRNMFGKRPDKFSQLALSALAGLTIFSLLYSTRLFTFGVESSQRALPGEVATHVGILQAEFSLEKLKSQPLGFWLTHAVTVLVAPLFEEVVFRGLILRKLLQRTVPTIAIILSAAIFGLVHFDENVLYASLAGVALGYIYYKSGSLWVVVGAHMSANLLSMVMTSSVSVVLSPRPNTYGWNVTLVLAIFLLSLAALTELWIPHKLNGELRGKKPAANQSRRAAASYS